MKKILIDLNILLDFLNKRNFHQEAANLLGLCAEKKIRGYICAHEITTLSYFLQKEKQPRNKVISTMDYLFDLLTVIPATQIILKQALLSPISDYEDAVIEVSAIQSKIDFIISRNLHDFKKSRIPTLTPEQYRMAHPAP
jgi:predicted nucleic acid-binding protein